MKRRTTTAALLLPLLAVLACAPADEDVDTMPAQEEAGQAAPTTPEAKIRNATGAAPAELAVDATVMDWPASEGEEMTELRAGTNGWTCMPDIPHTPGNDPMCLDPVFAEWGNAWQSRTAPPEGSFGLAYMLRGGADASNTDPFATEPAAGEDWVNVGPHVMIVVPDPTMLESMTDDPETGGPWVMWKGTPYAHVMVPLGG